MKRVLGIMVDISDNKKMKTSEIQPMYLETLKKLGYVKVLAGGWVKLSKKGNKALLY